MGTRPSFAWRSIWNARQLLQAGLVWRVGNGHSIHIWGDRWLPTQKTHMVQSPISILGQDARVKELMDESTRWWNIPLIEEIFTKEEVKVICNMVICLGGQQDKLIWAGTKHGIFTVHSAYHLAKSLVEEGKGSCSSEEGYGYTWRRI